MYHVIVPLAVALENSMKLKLKTPESEAANSTIEPLIWADI